MHSYQPDNTAQKPAMGCAARRYTQQRHTRKGTQDGGTCPARGPAVVPRDRLAPIALCRRLCPNPGQDRISVVKGSFEHRHTAARAPEATSVPRANEGPKPARGCPRESVFPLAADAQASLLLPGCVPGERPLAVSNQPRSRRFVRKGSQHHGLQVKQGGAQGCGLREQLQK